MTVATIDAVFMNDIPSPLTRRAVVMATTTFTRYILCSRTPQHSLTRAPPPPVFTRFVVHSNSPPSHTRAVAIEAIEAIEAVEDAREEGGGWSAAPALVEAVESEESK